MGLARRIADYAKGIFTDSSGNVGVGTTSPNKGGVSRAVTLNTASGGNIIEMCVAEDRKGWVYADDARTVLSAGGNRLAEIQTNGVARIAVDGSGRVTMPNQPMFQAMLQSTTGSTTNVTGGDIYQFSSIRINRGSHFNGSTFRFTAPIAGVYCIGFTVSFYRSSTAARRSIGLFVNGSLREYVDFTPNQDFDIAEIQTLMSLGSNDFVDVRQMSTQSGDQYWGGGNSGAPVGSFRGFLVG